MKKPEICGIHHLSIKATNKEDYEKAYDFYNNILALPVAMKWGPEGCPKNVMFSTGGGFVELLFQDQPKEAGYGSIKHLAFEVKNTDECVNAIIENGYKVTVYPKDVTLNCEPPMRIRIAFCIGPMGEEIEFFQIYR